ncbi:cupin domain-containing protein [Rhodobaculum claviforme]|uniref:(S)-ureidoglycine aminohydrolase cupin domain-containing protein n=1 Tax=Rhodobaculum claviforme TaxID=1549854 RepID=A0A934WJY0_9RHOB|nr:cupin domain-containing protein [Rhodobaculum claviforme]MBK5928397.1 hypothetical protein [Rhodobaculum claviforme]
MTSNLIRLQDDPPGGMDPSHLALPGDFTTDDHTEREHVFHATPDGAVAVSVWQCAPLKKHFDAYPCDEFIVVVSGRVTITDDAGAAQTFGPGDTFFLQQGRACTWEITQTLSKLSMAVGSMPEG